MLSVKKQKQKTVLIKRQVSLNANYCNLELSFCEHVQEKQQKSFFFHIFIMWRKRKSVVLSVKKKKKKKTGVPGEVRLESFQRTGSVEKENKNQRACFPPFFPAFSPRRETWLVLYLRDLCSSEFKTRVVLKLSKVLLASSSIPWWKFPRVLNRLFSLLWSNCGVHLIVERQSSETDWHELYVKPHPEEPEKQKFPNETKQEDKATLKQHVYIGLCVPGSSRSLTSVHQVAPLHENKLFIRYLNNSRNYILKMVVLFMNPRDYGNNAEMDLSRFDQDSVGQP